MNAAKATMDEGAQQIRLRDGVTVISSTGYVLTSDSMVSSIDHMDVESLAPVQGEGPLGTLVAGKMHIKQIENSNDIQMLFTDGVKMVYLPQNK